MTTPVFNAASAFFGFMGKRRRALFGLQPKGGDYPTGPDTDMNPSTGVTVAYAEGVVLVDPSTGLAIVPANSAPYSAAVVPQETTSYLTANASCSAAIPAVAGKYSYLTSVAFTAAGSTAGVTVQAAISGLTTALAYAFTFPTGATVAALPLVLTFDPPLQSSAVNTAITATLPAGGAGNLAACVTVVGYNQ